jgi:hypothetical protein
MYSASYFSRRSSTFSFSRFIFSCLSAMSLAFLNCSACDACTLLLAQHILLVFAKGVIHRNPLRFPKLGASQQRCQEGWQEGRVREHLENVSARISSHSN